MKLIIQIPCFNEADSLPQTIPALPRSLLGVDRIDVVVVERHRTNRGLNRQEPNLVGGPP